MKNQRFIAFILILILSLSILAGCDKKDNQETAIVEETPEEPVEENIEENEAKEEYGVTINKDTVSFIDGRGEEVNLNKNPERVVVIYNSLLDVWMQNGGSIIGRIEESVGQDPIPGIEDAEIVGKLGAISLEKILSLEPDLVILMSSQQSQMEVVPSLEENNIAFAAMEYNGKEDYFKLVRLFSALNERDDLYEENLVKVEKDIDKIIEKVPNDKETKVLLMVASAKSISARGSDTTVGEMLQDLHTINIADHSNDALSSTNFSIEKILEEDPDFIFVQTTGSDMEKVMERMKEDVESNPAWSTLSAVKNDRYIILPKDLYWFKPNNKFAEAYEGLAEIIYPEVFK